MLLFKLLFLLSPFRIFCSILMNGFSSELCLLCVFYLFSYLWQYFFQEEVVEGRREYVCSQKACKREKNANILT